MWSGINWPFAGAAGSISIIWFLGIYINICKGLVSLHVWKRASRLNVAKICLKQSSCFCNGVWLCDGVKVQRLLCSFSYSSLHPGILGYFAPLTLFLVTLEAESDGKWHLSWKKRHFLPEVWASVHFSVQEMMRHRVSIFVTIDIEDTVHTKGVFLQWFGKSETCIRPTSTACSMYVTQREEGSLLQFCMLNFIMSRWRHDATSFRLRPLSARVP